MYRTGETLSRRIAMYLHPESLVDTTALAAIPEAYRADGKMAVVGATTTAIHLWVWVDASTATPDSTHVLAADAPATGRWVQLV